MQEIHTPVLVKELRVLLNLKPGNNAIDATLNGGGHARMMLELIKPDGKILGIDQDKNMVEKMSRVKNLIAVWGNFKEIGEIIKKYDFKKVKAILFDLGMSRWHIEASGRGFSFERPDEPLLMQMDVRSQKNAALILNTYPEKELIRIFKEFGEVRAPQEIAKKIILARKVKRIYSVGDLLYALGIKNKKSLAKIFQALRIAVNDELEALEQGLKNAFDLLSRGNRIAVIAYHSLEDRIVKNFFSAKGEISPLRGGKKALILTKKPIIPSQSEILKNPSSRSAKLRVLEKI